MYQTHMPMHKRTWAMLLLSVNNKLLKRGERERWVSSTTKWWLSSRKISGEMWYFSQILSPSFFAHSRGGQTKSDQFVNDILS